MLLYLFRMSHILRMSTEHITAPLADEDNYAYCQSRGAHNIKFNVLLKLNEWKEQGETGYYIQTTFKQGVIIILYNVFQLRVTIKRIPH